MGWASAAAPRDRSVWLRQDSEATINSLDFHRTEDLLVTASDDDSIHLYNTSAGEHLGHPLFSKKYGVSHVRFTHHRNSVVYASTKVRGRGTGGTISVVYLLYEGSAPVHHCRQFRSTSDAPISNSTVLGISSV